jgi:NAD(P)H-nitrite reductase large subunit
VIVGTREDQVDRKLLCYCLNVRWVDVEEAVRAGNLRTVAEVSAACRAGTGCRSCHPEIEEVLAAARARRGSGLRRLVGRLLGRQPR